MSRPSRGDANIVVVVARISCLELLERYYY